MRLSSFLVSLGLGCLASVVIACSDGHPVAEPDDGASDASIGGGASTARDGGAVPASGGASAPGGGASGGAASASGGGGASTDALNVDPDDAATYLFDADELREYALDIAPADLALIDADPRAEQYVPATLTFEGQSYAVQARYKGSVGGFRNCVGGDGGGFEAGGAKTCTKLSMKVAFDQVDPEGRFYGLRKLQFHSMNRDPSMLKERLGYAIFRQMDLPAPRAVHARLIINGQLSGVYALIEQIDGRFTRSRFTEGGEGNLYKEAWPIGMDRIGRPDAYFLDKLETNEDQAPSVDTMVRFGAELQATSLAQLPELIGRYTDRDALMRYVATDRALAHDDGPFHWYCGGGAGACSNHNFFIYEETDSDRLWLVVWDLDSVFNLDNEITTIAFPWDDTTLGCAPRLVPPATLEVVPPACDVLTLGLASMQEEYLQQLTAVLDGPLSEARVEPQLEAWEAQIEASVAEASALHADAITPDAWLSARQVLRVAIENLRKRAAERVQFGPVVIGDPFGT